MRVEGPRFCKDVMLDCGYRADLVIEDQLIVAIKSVAGISPIHEAHIPLPNESYISFITSIFIFKFASGLPSF